MAIVGWPPILRCRHNLIDIFFQLINVNILNSLGIIEIIVHRIRLRRVMAENLQVQLIRPPVLVGSHLRLFL